MSSILREKTDHFYSIAGHDVKTELIKFIGYLACSDGNFDKVETDFINGLFDEDFTPKTLGEFVAVHNIYSLSFEKEVPPTLIRLLKEDNKKHEQNILESSDARAYAETFALCGREFIGCDSNVDKREIDDYEIYMNMINSYINENSDFDNVKSSLEIEKKRITFELDDEDDVVDKPLLVELMDELDSLVGLETVKKEVTSLIHFQEIQRIRKERGLPLIPTSNHLVFSGNPGTGKTTVARLLAKIYYALGILSSDAFVEVDRSGLVGGYVGQTAIRTQEKIEEAMGGVLFVDEAYSLAGKSENDYGSEAIETILKAMEDNRDNLIVIVAGYIREMEEFINSNPGLRSRFNKYITFEDYEPGELKEIFIRLCEKSSFLLTEEAEDYIGDLFIHKYETRDRNFANGREARNVFEKAVFRQAGRLFGTEPTDEELMEIRLEDVEE